MVKCNHLKITQNFLFHKTPTSQLFALLLDKENEYQNAGHANINQNTVINKIQKFSIFTQKHLPHDHQHQQATKAQ